MKGIQPETSYLIFTDLDGTLLDHNSYRFDAVLSTLDVLKREKVPVIPVTSKTEAELRELRLTLDLSTPFVVENGAAIYIPEAVMESAQRHDQSAFCVGGEQMTRIPGFYVKAFSRSREDWQRTLRDEFYAFSHCYQSFAQLGEQKIADLTGLSLAKAKLANDRHYSEPLYWVGTDDEKMRFASAIQARQMSLLEGGRFLHLVDAYDKGTALQWLRAFYQSGTNESVFSCIALGDSQNDVAMLEAADIALLVQSPKHDWPRLARDKGVFRSNACGPQGWSELVNQHVISNL